MLNIIPIIYRDYIETKINTNHFRVVFYFKPSKRANNGTGVNAGQIPQLLYRINTPENSNLNHQKDQTENIYILKREFSRTVTKVSTFVFQSTVFHFIQTIK